MIVIFGAHVENDISICWVFRGVKSEKMIKNYQLQSVLLSITGTVDHIIMISIIISPGLFLNVAF